MKAVASVFALTVWCAAMIAPLSGAIIYTGTPISENFNSLPTSTSASHFPSSIGTPTAVPGASGWVGTRLGPVSASTMPYTNWFTTFTGTGGSVVGAATLTGNTERALGTLTSAAHQPSIGVEIINNSIAALSEVTISFWQENWRIPGQGASSEVGEMSTTLAEYGTTDSGITSATIFTATSGFSNASALNLVSAAPVVDNTPNPGDHAAAAVIDGNLPANRVFRTATIDFSSSPIGVGELLFLRFNDIDNVGGDAITAIDDFELSSIPEPSAIVLTSIVLTLGMIYVRHAKRKFSIDSQ